MATTNRLVSSPFVNRLVTNPLVFRLLFTSFVTKRFASQTRLLGDDDWLFLNYGYEEDPPMDLPLEGSDEPHRYLHPALPPHGGPGGSERQTGAGGQLRPRRRIVISDPHAEARLLHGAGLEPGRHRVLQKSDTICPAWNSSTVTPKACRFPIDSYDAVVNVEASHLYPDVPRFLAEVARVLRPGGHFLYADFRRRQRCR